ncbi:metal ABC transporter solute-binding protein, Zn/Mn family [Sulfurovum sp.]|uniref:metal ABC transporter substrate-binding protein n=1 Tax=Sulfurovum sp. TaxID=1969726 RepID=UPI00286825B3|nr:zinc ABC transporter substrate-binding protein [Sulfurovum sp.]
MKIPLLLLLLASTLSAKLNVAAAYPYIKEITQEIAKGRVDITLLSQGHWDPHFVVPKPSLIAQLRDSDLLIINGASLEIGWLPPLLSSANNPNIQKNVKGYLDLSQYVNLQDIPKSVDRSMGDVHAEGNPHFILDPHNVIKIAKVISLKLSSLDDANKAYYQNNFEAFKMQWEIKLNEFDKQMKACKGMNVIQYHELFNYFLRRYGINSLDNIEPLAGVSPNSRHTLELIDTIKKNNIRLILQDVYHEHKTADFLAEKTGAKVVKMPHDIDSLKGTSTLEGFYGTLVKQLCR